MPTAKQAVKLINYAPYGYASGYTQGNTHDDAHNYVYGYALELHPQTTFLSPEHRSDHYNFSWKKNKYLASCFFRKTISFKESSPSIMVIINPNWLTEIL
jgi:hypothetical protein